MRLLVVSLGVLVTLFVGECSARFYGLGGVEGVEIFRLRAFLRNGPVIYRPYPYTGYVVQDPPYEDPVRPVDWSFDLPDHPDVLRIACLGGSTTWHNYPTLLQEELVARTGRTFQVMNWGVPGWTSQETMVNYFINVQDYEPDVVILHHATNDVGPRLQEGFRNDYAHFRKVWEPPRYGALERSLVLHSNLYATFFIKRGGAPQELHEYVVQPRRGRLPTDPVEPYPTGTESAFRRNVATVAEHVTNHGGRVVLMTMPYNLVLAGNADDPYRPAGVLWEAVLREHNEILRALAREGDYLLVDGEAWVARDPEAILPLFKVGDRVHFTPEGVRAKARLVADALIEAGWVAP